MAEITGSQKPSGSFESFIIFKRKCQTTLYTDSVLYLMYKNSIKISMYFTSYDGLISVYVSCSSSNLHV